MSSFYEKAVVIDSFKKIGQPRDKDVEHALSLIAGDNELTRYFYDKNEQGELSSNWIELLDIAGQFECLRDEDAGIVERCKTSYLVDCAAVQPEAVVQIITRIEAKDAWIQGTLTSALAEMPEHVATKGIPVVVDYLGGREYKIWHFIGEASGKLMLKLIDEHPEQAFEVAKALLDVWLPGEDARSRLDNIRAKFDTHDYKRLMFDFYSKLWAKRPVKATSLLVDIYGAYLEQCNKEQGYDTSEYSGISVEDLEHIERLDYNLKAAIIKGICEAGKAAVVVESDKTGELLDDLEKREKAVFHRIAMHLLRFVKAGAETERINRLVENRRFMENPFYRYEHRRLLNDRFGQVSKKAREAFVVWIEKQKVSEETRKEITEWCTKNDEPLPDFEQMEHRKKAEELYLVSERFRGLFDKYKAIAGVKSDTALAPERTVSEVRCVSPMEGTPLELEEMVKMSVTDVIDFVLEPKNYAQEKKPGQWETPTEALEATFKADVKKRPIEYLECDSQKLQELKPNFIAALFDGIQNTARDGNFPTSSWPRLIDFAHSVVQRHSSKTEYRSCFSALLSVFRDGYTQEGSTIDFNIELIQSLWSIVANLVRYDEEYQAASHERDPMQMRCTSVKGEALEQAVMLGIVCRRDFREYYEDCLNAKIRELLDYVVADVRKPEVNCTLGADLGRIGWLDKEWLSNNIEKLFEGPMWDVVWGTHVSWGRPSRPGFKLLAERGIYAEAIRKLGVLTKFKFGKDPEEGFVEHLMIAFFNGWIDLEDAMLDEFFQKASVQLRGHAARFLTTGFKPEKDGGEDHQEVTQRVRAYWQKRIAAIKADPSENLEEAIELTGWGKDSLLDPKETLELLEQTLRISGGKLGKLRDTRDFVAGVCEFAESHELIALRCLKMAAADENMRMPWALSDNRLAKFLESLTDSADNIRAEALDVADAYGRLHPERFRQVWEKLRNMGCKDPVMESCWQVLSTASFEDLIPSKNETAALSVKPKTAALCYDRVWAPTNDLVPDSIRCYAGTPFERMREGGRLPAVYGVLKRRQESMMRPVSTDSFWTIANDFLTNLMKSDQDRWGILPYYLRVIAEQFSRETGSPIVPTYETIQDRDRVYEEGDRLAICLSLSDLEIVDEEKLTWEQVMDFRDDKEARKKYQRFLHWLDKEMIGSSQSFVEDDVSQRLEDYKRALKKHEIKTVAGSVEEALDGKDWAGPSGRAAVIMERGHPILTLLGAGLRVGRVVVKLVQTYLTFDDVERGFNSELSWVYEVKQIGT